MLDWRRYASLCGNRYFLPSIGSVPTTFSETDGAEFGSLVFCLNGLCAILGIRRDFMISVMKNLGGLPIRNHALHGKVGLLANRTKKLSPTYESLHGYFKSLQDKCQPFSTVVVREITGLQIRGDTDAVHLPPSYSKRQLYCKWVWLCGYKVTKTSMAKITYVTIVEMEPRINDDSAANPTWPIGSIATQVISWKNFLGF